MRYENKRWHREDNFFVNSVTSYDLSNVRVLHNGVDTVKELYQCCIKPELLVNLEYAFNESFERIYSSGGYNWLVSKSSKTTGYQYILRNNDVGLVVLLKSFYIDADLHGSHMKIEGSPHLINSMTPEQYSAFTMEIARLFGHQVQAIGCAVHLAVDLKGWKPDTNFEYALVTRSKRRMAFAGISNATYDMAECSAIYGDRQTFTFGAASSVQFSVYDKVTEAIKSDKIDYWENQWLQIPAANDFMETEYKPGDQVTRIEGRLHHSVIQQFCNGTFDDKGKNIVINSFADCSEHLTALWHYVLNNFRLHHSTSYVHPLWQLLEEDLFFFKPAPDFHYKRAQKKPDNDNVKRKIAIWLGNTIRLYARRNFKTEYIVGLLSQASLDDEIGYYLGLPFTDKDLLHSALMDFVDKKREVLILQGIAA